MPEFEVVRQIAKQVLTAHAPSGNRGHWLWDRTCRILRNIEQISRLPEPAGQTTAIDRPCLITAAYFAESGCTHQPSEQNASGPANSGDYNDTDRFAASTQIVTKQLAAVLNEARIDKVNKIITESTNRFTSMTEAMILSDARNLEDLGTIGLLHDLRRSILQGKSISELLDSWKCKIEYGYWQARIKESFRFDPVRQIAEQRLAAAAAFMDQLALENSARDLEEYVLEKAQKT
jgi:hypothetical protein